MTNKRKNVFLINECFQYEPVQEILVQQVQQESQQIYEQQPTYDLDKLETDFLTLIYQKPIYLAAKGFLIINRKFLAAVNYIYYFKYKMFINIINFLDGSCLCNVYCSLNTI